jgi:2-haloacid dehalogenase
MSKRPLIVFDVNETLLDIDCLEPLFADIFGTPGRMREWFAQVILYSQALTLAGRYVPFGTLGGGVLRMLGELYAIPVMEQHVRRLGTLMAAMPVHPDVSAGLAELKNAGFAIVTLTNSPKGEAPDALERAGLGPMFDHRFTVDTVHRFKPAPATYQLVQDTMGTTPDTTWLVAAHSWDTIGAQAFGWKAALITRGMNAPLVIDGIPRPTLVACDVHAAARAIIARQ